MRAEKPTMRDSFKRDTKRLNYRIPWYPGTNTSFKGTNILATVAFGFDMEY